MRRIRLGLLAGVIAAMVVPVALALAATSTAPSATTAAATSVSDTGATLNGSVNPESLSTNYAFQWGPTSGYGEETTLSAAGSGGAAVNESSALTGLDPGTSYHFRTIAISSAGISVGADQTFTTTGTAPAPSTPPTAVTSSATGVGQAGATLRGSVNPSGQASTYHFEYGTSNDYGYETSATSAGSGTTAAPVTDALTGLVSGTTYHYRLVALSPGGVTLGSDVTFTTTTPPAVTSSPPSDLSSDAATFNGTVNPEGHGATYYFQYGTATTYGLQTAPAAAGSGTTAVSVHADATGLAPNTTYHYRLVSTSSGGTSYGTDEKASTTGASSVVKLMGHMGFVSPGGVIGVEVGCFNGSSACDGSFKMTVDGNTIGSGSFKLNANTGGFQNIKLNSAGQSDLTGNRVNHLLTTNVTIKTTSGQTVTGTLSLARWSWTDR